MSWVGKALAVSCRTVETQETQSDKGESMNPPFTVLGPGYKLRPLPLPCSAMSEITSGFRASFPQLKMPVSSDYCRIKGDEAYEGTWLPIGTKKHLNMNQKQISFIFRHAQFETVSFPSSSHLSHPPVLLQDGDFCIQGLPGASGVEHWPRG